MSTLSQFAAGSASTAIPLWGPLVGPKISPPEEIHLGAQEFLLTGVLKPVAGYEASLVNYPSMGLRDEVYTNIASPTGITVSSDVYLYELSASAYYSFSNGYLRYATTLGGTHNTVPALVNVFTHFKVGTKLVVLSSSATYGLSCLTADAFTTMDAAVYLVGAANAANTLGVAVKSLAAVNSNIRTSTDGVTWTSRTPSVPNVSHVPKLMYWSALGGYFVMLVHTGTTFDLWKSTDGFTWTMLQEAFHTGSEVTAYTKQANSHVRVASSGTAEVILVASGSSVSCAVYRTTDGITYSKIFAYFTSVDAGYIYYDTDASLFITGAIAATTSNPQPGDYMLSVDNGATFKPSVSYISSTSAYRCIFTVAGNTACRILADGSIWKITNVGIPTHIGLRANFQTPSPTYFNYYVRIK